MPSTVTHSYFIIDVYNKLEIDTKIFLKDEKEKLKVFSQSMDVLNFYISTNRKKSKKIRNFANIFHTKKTSEFIITLINYIKFNYYGYNPEAIAFLYGIISHYILDSTIHPYIYYKTGEFNCNDKSTYKYNSKHHEIETSIDKYLIEKQEKIKSYKYKHYQNCFNVSGFSNNLKEIINFCYKETYGIKNFDKFYLKSIKNMKKAFKVFRYDPYCIKLVFYRLFDIITPKNILNTKFLSYHYNGYKYDDYLNVNKNIWYNPTSKSLRYNSSFEDLYKESIKKCVNTIKKINEYIYDNKKIDLEKTLNNLSYKTGIDLNKKQELKYFEF